jgi:branched-chain amino acid transport system permease protein
MELLLQYLWNGLANGAVYGLVALGITLVYGLTRIIHFAVGAMVMLGAYISFAVQDATGSFALALIASIVAVGLFGLITERAMFRFTLDSPLSGFIVSLGLIIFLQSMAMEIWTTETRSVQPPLDGAVRLGDVVLSTQALFNTALIVLVLAVAYVLLTRTRHGKALRAAADDREAAGLMGVPVRRLITVTFVIGAALAGVAGWVVLTVGSVNPMVGGDYLLRGFAVALIGGLGNIKGAAVAGIGLGLAEALAVGYLDPAWSGAYVFTLVVLVLLWKPRGLGAGVEGARL